MDWPADVLDPQVAQEWQALMGGLASLLGWAVWLGVLAFALGGLVVASRRIVRPHRFWCPWARRDVEALFEEWGPPGFRQTVRVVACSAFEPTCAVTCQRGCRDATRRAPGASPALLGLRAG